MAAGLGSGALLALVLAALAWASSSPSVTEYSSGLPSNADPTLIAPGPDGAMWFAELSTNRIGRIAADGTITQFAQQLPADSDPADVVAQGGMLWFTEHNGAIGELNPGTGQLVGNYPVPSGAGSEPEGITVGPDGALWFTETDSGQIGRLDPTEVSSGTSDGITEYPVSGQDPYPDLIVTGPDGALWVTLEGLGEVARLDPAQASAGTSDGLTTYPLPSGVRSEPFGITVGPDNALWVSEGGSDNVARVDPGDVTPGTSDGISEFPVGAGTFDVTPAGDGALWFTGIAGGLVRVDPTTDDVTEVTAGLTGTAVGDSEDAAGNLWLTVPNSSPAAIGTIGLSSSMSSTSSTTTTTSSGSPTTTTTSTTTSGTTTTSAGASPPTPPTPGGPTITTTFLPGQVLACDPDAAGWSGSPTFSYQWLRDGSPVPGATFTSYTLTTADGGHTLACRVTGTNSAGSASIQSTVVHVGVATSTSSRGDSPVAIASLTSREAVSAPVTIDLALSQPGGGSPIAGYHTTFRTAGGTFAASCPASEPFVTATFSAPTSVTATVTATNQTGASSSTSLPFTVSRLAKGASVAAIRTGSAAAAVMSTNCSGSAPPNPPSGGGAHTLTASGLRNICQLFSYSIDAGLVDAEAENGCYLQGGAGIVPAAEWALLRDKTVGDQTFNQTAVASASRAQAMQATDQASDTFYVFDGPVMVNGLDIEPSSGATVVLAVGGSSTGFIHQNAAYLVSSDATIYARLPLPGGNSVKVPLNWTGGTLGDALTGDSSDIGSTLQQAGSNALQQEAGSLGKSTGIVPPHAGGPINLDVSAVKYVVTQPGDIETVRPHTSQVVSKFDLASALGPLKPTGLPFTLSGTVRPSFDIADNGEPETTLADVQLGIPGILGGDKGNLTGAASIHADNAHNGAYLKCLGLSLSGTDPAQLSGIPLKNLAVTYYGSGGADLPGCIGAAATTTHHANALVLNGDLVLLGGDITGRFELDTGKVPPTASSWTAVLNYDNPAGLDILPGSPVPVFLSSAQLNLDDSRLTGTVKLFAGAPGLGSDGCGAIGYDGQVELQWKPNFLLDGTGESNVLCAPFGESDAFLVEQTPNGNGNVLTVAVKRGLGFSIPGLLTVMGSGSAGLSISTGPTVLEGPFGLNGFEADLDGNVDLELPSLPFLSGSTPSLSLSGSAQFVASDKGVGTCLSVSATATAGQGLGDFVTSVTGSSDIGGFVNDVFNTATAPLSGASLKVGAGFKYFGLPDAITTTALAVTGPGVPIIAARLLLGNDINFGSCDVANYQTLDLNSLPAVGTASSVQATTRSAAAKADSINVTPGETQLVVMATGRGGAPAPVLTTPDGKIHIDTGVAAGHYGPILIIHQNSTTEIDIADPKVGRWTLGIAPGSTPISHLATEHVVPPLAAHGTVRRVGKGPTDVLRYKLSNAVPGTSLAFAERTASGTIAPIASVIATTHTTGTLRFKPAPLGAGRRTIVITPVRHGGTPGPTITVTRYTAPANKLGPPTRVHARRVGNAVRVSFVPGANASGGDIAVLRLSNARVLSGTAASGRRSITVTGVGHAGVVAITVRGIRGNAYGPAVVLIAHKRPIKHRSSRSA